MIPIYKLARLPFSQRIRKIIKTLTCIEKDPVSPPYFWLHDVFALLASDAVFSTVERSALQNAQLQIQQQLQQPQNLQVCTSPKTLRAVNKVRHVLLARVGIAQADWDFIDSEGKLDAASRTCFPGMEVYFEDIRSPYNVGAMFRTAESFGAAKIYLSSLCASPTHIRASRSAMGCVDVLPWEYVPEISVEAQSVEGDSVSDGDDFLRLKFAKGIPIFALEKGGTNLNEFPFPCAGILVVGSEELGVRPQTLELAASSLKRLSIPSYGAKGSLNVSVAFGIAMQRWAETLRRCSIYHSPSPPHLCYTGRT
ncbi:MAG: TrmH family RNA methyltransferase [Termitinemataceae bacterium]|nr:MAG: TrmH family RNA methyltransferase [Termitinemataceae bacterium]